MLRQKIALGSPVYICHRGLAGLACVIVRGTSTSHKVMTGSHQQFMLSCQVAVHAVLPSELVRTDLALEGTSHRLQFLQGFVQRHSHSRWDCHEELHGNLGPVLPGHGLQ